MKHYTGGTVVRGGYYWNVRGLELVNVPGEAGTLPETPDTAYVRMPLPAVFVAVPAMGAALVIAVPLIGFGLLTQALARRAGLFGGGAKPPATKPAP